MADLRIRSIQSSDREEWARLWNLYLAFYKTTLSQQIFDSTFSRLVSGEDNEFSGLIALKGEQPVGITHYLFHRTCWSQEDVCYLQDLYVDETVRGTGAGRALIEAVYSAADAAGAPSVYWHTQHFNYSGRRLYDRVAELTPFLRYDRPK